MSTNIPKIKSVISEILLMLLLGKQVQNYAQFGSLTPIKQLRKQPSISQVCSMTGNTNGLTDWTVSQMELLCECINTHTHLSLSALKPTHNIKTMKCTTLDAAPSVKTFNKSKTSFKCCLLLFACCLQCPQLTSNTGIQYTFPNEFCTLGRVFCTLKWTTNSAHSWVLKHREKSRDFYILSTVYIITRVTTR